MHDRALVFFTNGETASFGICLFRHPNKVPSLLANTATRMACIKEPAAIARAISSIGAPRYCASRFLGVYADFYSLSGNVRLGPDHVDEELEALLCRAVRPLTGSFLDLEASRTLQTFSRDLGLEAGLVVVDVSAATWSWKAFGGYLQSTPKTPDGGWFEVHLA